MKSVSCKEVQVVFVRERYYKSGLYKNSADSFKHKQITTNALALITKLSQLRTVNEHGEEQTEE